MKADAAGLLAAHARRLWDDDPNEFAMLLGGLVRRLILDQPDGRLARMIVRELDPDALGDLTTDAAATAPELIPAGLIGPVDQANAETRDGTGRTDATRLGRLVAGSLLAGGEVVTG